MGRSLAVILLALVGLLSAAGMGFAAYFVSRDSVAVPVTRLQPKPQQQLAPRRADARPAERRTTSTKTTGTTTESTSTVDDDGGNRGSGGGGGDDSSGRGGGGGHGRDD